jgi:hypothetical protein
MVTNFPPLQNDSGKIIAVAKIATTFDYILAVRQ